MNSHIKRNEFLIIHFIVITCLKVPLKHINLFESIDYLLLKSVNQ